MRPDEPNAGIEKPGRQRAPLTLLLILVVVLGWQSSGSTLHPYEWPDKLAKIVKLRGFQVPDHRPGPPPPPAQPAPTPPALLVKGAIHAHGVAGIEMVTADDYPPSAIRRGAEGTSGFELDIDGSGRPAACRITRSSGQLDLDLATCRAVMARARFTPARDADGTPVPDVWRSRVRWVIPT